MTTSLGISATYPGHLVACPGEVTRARLAQLDDYLEGLGLPTGWLVIFDERPAAVRTHREVARSPAGRELTVLYA